MIEFSDSGKGLSCLQAGGLHTSERPRWRCSPALTYRNPVQALGRLGREGEGFLTGVGGEWEEQFRSTLRGGIHSERGPGHETRCGGREKGVGLSKAEAG